MHGKTLTHLDKLKIRLAQSQIAFEEADRDGKTLLIESPDTDYLLELCADGKLLCQFGVDLEELRGMISGGTTEDLSSDELQRSAREHLRPIVAQYRGKLIAAGFEEEVEATEEHYAITFKKALDLDRPEHVIEALKWCRKLKENTHAR
jgi:hypothetical protein